VFAADEYYLLAGRPFPPAAHYGDFPMVEDGIGMARAFEAELAGERVGPEPDAAGERGGFFRSADAGGSTGLVLGCGADLSLSVDAEYEPYRGARAGASGGTRLHIGASRNAPVGILTAPYGARVLGPVLDSLGRPDVRLVVVENEFFGGNVAVTGLMVGADLARVLAGEPEGHRYLLPDVCLTQGRFLDGTEPADLPRPVEVVPTDGRALRSALGLPVATHEPVGAPS
jgi:hypothetical protein